MVNFTRQKNKFCFGLHYSEVNSYIFIIGVEIYKFKAKDSDLNTATSTLGNVLKVISVDNMKTLSYIDDILGTHKHLMKKHDMKEDLN